MIAKRFYGPESFPVPLASGGVEMPSGALYLRPGIDTEGRHTWFWLPPWTEHRKDWLLSLSPKYHVLLRDVWLAQFFFG